MEQMNTGVTPELESKILNLNIENYLKTFDKKQGLTWQIIGYDNKKGKDIEMLHTLESAIIELAKYKNNFSEYLKNEVETGIYDEDTILKNEYKKQLNSLEDEDFKRIELYCNGTFRDLEAKKELFGSVLSKLILVQNVQVLREQMQVTEPKDLNMVVVDSIGKDLTKAMKFKLLKYIGIQELLVSLELNTNIEKGLFMDLICSSEPNKTNVTTQYKKYMQSELTETEKKEVQSIIDDIKRYKKGKPKPKI